jgi:hypothetical protein
MLNRARPGTSSSAISALLVPAGSMRPLATMSAKSALMASMR